ncbi:MAG TPA: hypothetical protein DDZ51_06575 [Planctomycetaceae bacterium]|nr:hypothetical protein [Planctomycetaceae bacterium]
MDVALLIPTTSRGRNFKTIDESLLACRLVASLRPNARQYCTLYIGYDEDDEFYVSQHASLVQLLDQFGIRAFVGAISNPID